jgi:hypothetical protein
VWLWHVRVWLWHVRVWFTHAESNFYTQRVFSTRTRLVSTRRRRLRFPYAESGFTRRMCFLWLTRMCVNITLTSVIYTRSTVISTRRVYFLHAVWFRQARMWFHKRQWKISGHLYNLHQNLDPNLSYVVVNHLILITLCTIFAQRLTNEHK